MTFLVFAQKHMRITLHREVTPTFHGLLLKLCLPVLFLFFPPQIWNETFASYSQQELRDVNTKMKVHINIHIKMHGD